MEYAKIGNTDIEVSKLCVGCMSFGKAGTMHDWTVDKSETEKIVKHALDLGINFFDTANGYSEGTSEEYLGNALRNNISRDKVVIASKVYFNPGRLSSEAIHREIDLELRRYEEEIDADIEQALEEEKEAKRQENQIDRDMKERLRHPLAQQEQERDPAKQRESEEHPNVRFTDDGEETKEEAHEEE